MQNLSKKALSEIVSTVLIIFISLAAITLVFIAVKDITQKVQFSPEKLCLSQPMEIKNTCYNSLTSDLQVTITRNNLEQEMISSFIFLVDSNQETLSWQCGNCNYCKVLDSGEKTYYISLDKKPDKVSIKLDSCILDTKNIQDC